MDLITTTIASTTTTTTTIAATGAKSPEPEIETPTRIQPAKPFPSSNGVLKRHHPHYHHHNHANQQPLSVVYKECLKNHAASLGGHALDGCGEFMPSPSATSTDPTSLKCAACGCHRNFHRREPEDQPIPATHILEYQPHHRHHPPPPHQSLQAAIRSPNSASPPPISSSYFPSAPHMLLALSSGLLSPPENGAPHVQGVVSPNPSTRKRFRTKFSEEQKDKMYQFAERVGWKMQRRDDELIQELCNEVGVDRGVLKVWMHNNKNTLRKRGDHRSSNILEHEHECEHISQNNGSDVNNMNSTDNNDSRLEQNHYQNGNGANIATNGSSSSS